MMEDDTFQKIVVGGFVLLLIGMYMFFQLGLMLNSSLKEGLKCNQVVDMIYEQCKEEGNITIETLKGSNTKLTYENGVCVIK